MATVILMISLGFFSNCNVDIVTSRNKSFKDGFLFALFSGGILGLASRIS